MTNPTRRTEHRADREEAAQEARVRLDGHTSACLTCDDDWRCFVARQLVQDVALAEQWLR